MSLIQLQYDISFEDLITQAKLLAIKLASDESENSNDLAILQIIYDAMLSVENAVQTASDEHMHEFQESMQELLGFIPTIPEEPYLAAVHARFRLQLLQSLERFLNRVIKVKFATLPLGESEFDDHKGVINSGEGFLSEVLYLPASKFPHPNLLPEGEGIFKAAFNPKEPVIPQVEDRVALETLRMQNRLKQDLDEKRQRAIGVTSYIWRSSDDNRVRSLHASYDDQIFDWDNPPEGGHPGQAFGCRCRAEPVVKELGEPKVEVAAVQAVFAFEILAQQIVTRTAARRAVAAVAAGVALENLPEGEDKPEEIPGTDFPGIPGLDENLEPDDPDEDSEDDEERIRKLAEKIANGHAFEKHVVEEGEFPEVGSNEEFQDLIADIMNDSDEVKNLDRGRTGYWDNETGTVVIDSPNDPDGGTAFRPRNGKEWFDIELKNMRL